jgi:hypothetical protein
MLPTIACPTCRKPINLPEQYAGAVVNCPHCANALTVPQLYESPTAPVVLPARSGGQAVAASAFEDMSEQKLSSPRYRSAKQGGVPTLAIVLGVMFLAIIAGVLIYQQVDIAQTRDADRLSRQIDSKKEVGPVLLNPIAEPRPAKEKKKATKDDLNSEWERKSRDKLREGLELLNDKGRRDEAMIAIAYAYVDVPLGRNLTNKQLEMMLEIAYRLGVIATVEKDKQFQEKCFTSATYYRKELKWDIDKYEAWAEPLFIDTCFRMGIKK